MRGPPAGFETPKSGNSDSHDLRTYGCTLAISHTSDALNSARLGISTSATNNLDCCKSQDYNRLIVVVDGPRHLRDLRDPRHPRSLRPPTIPASFAFAPAIGSACREIRTFRGGGSSETAHRKSGVRSRRS